MVDQSLNQKLAYQAAEEKYSALTGPNNTPSLRDAIEVYEAARNADPNHNPEWRKGVQGKSLIERLEEAYNAAALSYSADRGSYAEGRMDAFDNAIAIAREHITQGAFAGMPKADADAMVADAISWRALHMNGNVDKLQPTTALENAIGLLQPIADCDWHGKWRVQKALAAMQSFMGAAGANASPVSESAGVSSIREGEGTAAPAHQASDATVRGHDAQYWHALYVLAESMRKQLEVMPPQPEQQTGDLLGNMRACLRPFVTNISTWCDPHAKMSMKERELTAMAKAAIAAIPKPAYSETVDTCLSPNENKKSCISGIDRNEDQVAGDVPQQHCIHGVWRGDGCEYCARAGCRAFHEKKSVVGVQREIPLNKTFSELFEEWAEHNLLVLKSDDPMAPLYGPNHGTWRAFVAGCEAVWESCNPPAPVTGATSVIPDDITLVRMMASAVLEHENRLHMAGRSTTFEVCKLALAAIREYLPLAPSSKERP